MSEDRDLQNPLTPVHSGPSHQPVYVNQRNIKCNIQDSSPSRLKVILLSYPSPASGLNSQQ